MVPNFQWDWGWMWHLHIQPPHSELRPDHLFRKALHKETKLLGNCSHSSDIEVIEYCVHLRCAFSMFWSWHSQPVRMHCLTMVSVDILDLCPPFKKNGHCDSMLTYPCPKKSDPCPGVIFDRYCVRQTRLNQLCVCPLWQGPCFQSLKLRALGGGTITGLWSARHFLWLGKDRILSLMILCPPDPLNLMSLI